MGVLSFFLFSTLVILFFKSISRKKAPQRKEMRTASLDGDMPARIVPSVSDVGRTDLDRVEATSAVRQHLDQMKIIDGEKVVSMEAIQENTSNRDDPIVPAVREIDVNTDVPLLSSQPSIAMFSGFTNSAIYGGSFVQNTTVNDNKRGLQLLHQRVATAAFHNSAQRVYPPRCHRDTRVAVMQRIIDWIVQSERREDWLLWLNGAAGAGKSAIMQSIAERCIQAAIAIASFFFSRADSTRNTMTPLIATLVYQLIQTIPQTEKEILSIIERNPLVFDQSLESQLQQLIVQPLLSLPKHLQKLFVILIDGLDECDDRVHQSNLIEVLGNVSSGRNISVVFIIASRREPQVEMAFGQKPQVSLLFTLPLDEINASDDIRRFLDDKFKEIKETHLRRHLLPEQWPPLLAAKEILTKSSGQFIYASVVVNYILSPRANPAHQLDIVRGIRLRDPSSLNPFAHLDALYQHIFSQVEALDRVLDILALVLLTKDYRIRFIEYIFQLADGELEVLLADLAAVIRFDAPTMPQAEIKFLHASLLDFLRDKSRSEEYYIDRDKYRTKLLSMLLEKPPPKFDPLSPTHNLRFKKEQEYARLGAIGTLLRKAKDSEQLRSAFMKFTVTFDKVEVAAINDINCIHILGHLRNLNLDDQDQIYQRVFDMFTTEFAKCWPSLEDDVKDYLGNSPDFVIRINQIIQENI